MLRVVVTLVMALDPVYAQEACTQAVAVTVPCKGLLLPMSEAAKAAKCIKVELPKCEAAITRCEDDSAVRQASCKKQLDSHVEFNKQLDKLLDKSLALPDKHWWESGGLIYGMGVVTGVAVLLGGAWGLKQLN